jgi:hypothetical protein
MGMKAYYSKTSLGHYRSLVVDEPGVANAADFEGGQRKGRLLAVILIALPICKYESSPHSLTI